MIIFKVYFVPNLLVSNLLWASFSRSAKWEQTSPALLPGFLVVRISWDHVCKRPLRRGHKALWNGNCYLYDCTGVLRSDTLWSSNEWVQVAVTTGNQRAHVAPRPLSRFALNSLPSPLTFKQYLLSIFLPAPDCLHFLAPNKSTLALPSDS